MLVTDASVAGCIKSYNYQEQNHRGAARDDDEHGSSDQGVATNNVVVVGISRLNGPTYRQYSIDGSASARRFSGHHPVSGLGGQLLRRQKYSIAVAKRELGYRAIDNSSRFSQPFDGFQWSTKRVTSADTPLRCDLDRSLANRFYYGMRGSAGSSSGPVCRARWLCGPACLCSPAWRSLVRPAYVSPGGGYTSLDPS